MIEALTLLRNVATGEEIWVSPEFMNRTTKRDDGTLEVPGDNFKPRRPKEERWEIISPSISTDTLSNT